MPVSPNFKRIGNQYSKYQLQKVFKPPIATIVNTR